jgi:hypothetical protein
VVVGSLVGVLLDGWWDTTPLLSLVGTGLGIVAAGVGFWLRIRPYLRG